MQDTLDTPTRVTVIGADTRGTGIAPLQAHDGDLRCRRAPASQRRQVSGARFHA